MAENSLVERYQIIQLLGEGGFAKTYLAADTQQAGAHCVIKHLTPANSSPQFLMTARRLFKAEADVLRRLGNHDRIPALWDAFEVDSEFYLVQEFIDGQSLHDIFKQQSPFTESQIVTLLNEVLSILAFIHQEQVIHRDIKPSNLMRRHSDGRLMLIDFGAVKEITTDFYTAGSEQFTVSIGTQGYSAPEQLAGRPRYSSDLYSLGMTVIRGLTGRSPTDLPENPNTGELLWQDIVPDISPGLQVFLQRLTHVSVYRRYPSATAALADLQHLDTLASPPALKIAATVIDTQLDPPTAVFRRWLRRAIAPFAVTAIVLSIRQVGGWMPLELLIHDEWVQRQTTAEPDDRLLIVEITEADLQALNQATPSDSILSRTIQTLQKYNPRVIGLDMYRDIPQGEGHAELLATLEAENVIAIRKLGTTPSDAISAPQSVSPDRVGFNDFPVDADGVIRRNLLFASTNNRPAAEVYYSFGLRLALAYLAYEGIVPLASELDPDYLELNGTTFIPLDKNFGGYRNVDDAGYQILMQYRSNQHPAPRLSLGDVLNGQFTEEMIRDRIVIIGTTAPSAKDLFYTPYSESVDKGFLMPGVVLHAQATSQILAAALDERRLPWAFPEAAEVGWIIVGVAGGALLGGTVKRLWLLSLYLLGGSLVLIAVPGLVFVAGGWLPVLSASLAYLGTAIATALSRPHLSANPDYSGSSPTDVSTILPFQK